MGIQAADLETSGEPLGIQAADLETSQEQGKAWVPDKEVLRGYWEGSFFVYTSLAYVNRELVLGLLKTTGCELSLIPYEQDQFGVEADPERFAALAEGLKKGVDGPVDFHLRHRWPPDFSRPPAGKLILIQPWEFGRIPLSWIEPLRRNVDQIWVPTSYVRNCYIESGVEPHKVVVVPNGMDPKRFHPGLEPMDLPTEKRFKFLFVGGTLQRKGIDLLLKAYSTLFGPADDVCLVIKDMGAGTFYRNQNAGEQIRALQADPGCAEILYLTDNMPDSEVPRLYAACDCLVHPYRGEGFGLPVLEAMACGLPVVVTLGGACDDFCSDDTAYRIPARRRQARYQEETVGSAWMLEPDLAILKSHMQQVFNDPEAARACGQRAAAEVHSRFSWDHAAARALDVLRQLCAAEDGAPVVEEPAEQEIAAVAEAGVTEFEGVTTVVVLEEIEAVQRAALEAALGSGLVVCDVTLADERGLGEQLEEIRRDCSGEFLVLLSGGVEDPAEMVRKLLVHMHSEENVALIGPCLQPQGQDRGIADVESPSPQCAIVRRAALDVIGGFEPSFRSVAVLDEVARGCRHQGWRVVCARDCALEQQRPSSPGDELLTLRERQAVRGLEEGDRFKAEGDRQAALEAYTKALSAKGDFVEVIMVLGALLLESGRGSEAIEVIKRLVEIDSQSVQGYNYLGLVQYQAQDWEGARHSFARVLELDPAYVETLINLGVLEWEQGDAEKALGYLEDAAALDAGNREVIMNIGLIHAQVGDSAAAIELLQNYTQGQPEDTEAHMLLADILLQNGEQQRARQIAAQVLEVQPDNIRARAIVERLSGQEEE